MYPDSVQHGHLRRIPVVDLTRLEGLPKYGIKRPVHDVACFVSDDLSGAYSAVCWPTRREYCVNATARWFRGYRAVILRRKFAEGNGRGCTGALKAAKMITCPVHSWVRELQSDEGGDRGVRQSMRLRERSDVQSAPATVLVGSPEQ